MDTEPRRRIGRYELLGELGHGGMAVVYRARDTQLLREVALKVLHPHLAHDPESRERFVREARAAARLRHPRIVEVHDFSADDERESFMVSELLAGPTVRAFTELHGGTMPAEVAAALGMVLCEALACAHALGIVHRDVKPDNLLLDGDGLFKLTDFGIAHVADVHSMTVTGQILGSPAHMAPEQIVGTEVDARTDLFAVGTVLYLLVVGRLPFEGSNPHALMRKILEVEYPDPLRAMPSAGHRFAAIVRRCLEREPSQRYSSALELRDALRDFVSEVGWEDPEAELRSYLRDPEGFSERHRAALLEVLPGLGVAARKEGKLPAALGYFNRALSLDPSNARVLGLVRSAMRRRRMGVWARYAAVIAAAAAVTSLGLVETVRWRRRHALAQLPLPPTPQPLAVRAEPPVAPPPALPPVSAPPPAAPLPPPPVALAPAVPPPGVLELHPLVNVRAIRNALVRQGADAAAQSAGPAVLRWVELRPNPPGVRFAVGSGELRDYGPTTRRFQVPVGPLHVRIVPVGVACAEGRVDEVVTASDEPLILRARLNCQGESSSNLGPDAVVGRP